MSLCSLNTFAGILDKYVVVWTAVNEAYIAPVDAGDRVGAAMSKALHFGNCGMAETAKVTIGDTVLEPSDDAQLNSQLGDRRVDIMLKGSIAAEPRGNECVDALFSFTARRELSKLRDGILLHFALRAQDVPEERSESGAAVKHYSQLASVADLLPRGTISAEPFYETVQQLVHEHNGYLMSEKQLRDDVQMAHERLLPYLRVAEQEDNRLATWVIRNIESSQGSYNLAQRVAFWRRRTSLALQRALTRVVIDNWNAVIALMVATTDPAETTSPPEFRETLRRHLGVERPASAAARCPKCHKPVDSDALFQLLKQVAHLRGLDRDTLAPFRRFAARHGFNKFMDIVFGSNQICLPVPKVQPSADAEKIDTYVVSGALDPTTHTLFSAAFDHFGAMSRDTQALLHALAEQSSQGSYNLAQRVAFWRRRTSLALQRALTRVVIDNWNAVIAPDGDVSAYRRIALLQVPRPSPASAEPPATP
ncbi:hypothetical protein JKP88DRAFT_274709 [Tribonema minus]|uniref:Uncharacterized protein n=1 Tax=Tribonema minus TaxID=303371 RepID=A0A835ZH42_9STRA|nr:hypothetical protein JKP88DRAFT_274709 [Tribonema minus]